MEVNRDGRTREVNRDRRKRAIPAYTIVGLLGENASDPTARST